MKKDESADFMNVIAFGKVAEVIAENFKKGSPILIKGHVQTGSYDHKDGYKVYTTDIIVDAFEFIGGGDKASSSNKGQSNQNNKPIEEDDLIPVLDVGDVPF